ncbi:FecR family protein [Caulobacter sp. UNC279MFTsu5.1]|uniref:FecR family protein n=1 Tax=Caulobacter sp. UNC279MFTsu5.1 TaxID=1502775 RepID=UPI0008E7E443|nr:FecR family protein [Caulobacter sp. UNC279MFTsu5.1]SFI52007.1 FecR family protein [Caulobacter sp. UNC279MFTsu5.1]
MIQQRHEVSRATREAADWLTRLSDPEIETDDLEAFSAWRANPDNRAAYERLEDLTQSLQSLAGDKDIEQIAADAFARAPRTAPWRLRETSRSTWLAIGAAAAALVIGAVAGVTLLRPTYSTGVGETFSARLEDGSRVLLNTDSQVRVRYSAGVRRVELLRGQALFEVAHNAARPFIVVAGDTQTRALGTRFEVRRDGQDVRVILTQGSVEITDKDAPKATWRLAPGQALAVPARQPALAKPRTIDVKSATSWTTGDLTFQDLPLAAAVAELNRYSQEKIILGDGVDADRVINGVFPAGENGDFIAAMSSLYGLESVRKSNGDVELHPKPYKPA